MNNLHSIFAVCLCCILITACGGGGYANPPSQPTTAGQVDLHWDTPGTRLDDSSLSTGELGGFRIYSSTDGTSFSRLAEINNSAATNYTITGLMAGTYYYYITAYDTAGDESPLSNVVNKTIQ